MFNGLFKNRTIGFILGFASSIVMLICAIVYFAVCAGDITLSVAAGVLLILAALSEIAVVLVDFKALVLLPAILASVGFGAFVYTAVPPITDLFTGVVFYGGNSTAAITFLILFAVCTVVNIAVCFLPQKKSAE